MRHGETQYRASGQALAGWDDCPLSERGKDEAKEVGRQLKECGMKFDFVFTSMLQRSVQTAWLACMESENFSMPIVNNWRLNERHYGALQGLTRAQITEKFSADLLKTFSHFDTSLPEVPRDDPSHPANDPRYYGLPKKLLPGAESMSQTVRRVSQFWDDTLAPISANGMCNLVVGHFDALRALCMNIEGLSQDEVVDLMLPRGCPLVYELDADLNVIKKYPLVESADSMPDKISKVPSSKTANLEEDMNAGFSFCQYVKNKSDHYDLVVLGGGPAGVRAAEEAASRGQNVALVEPKGCITGAPTGAHSKCLREAAISGARTWDEVQQILDRVMKNAHHEAMRVLRTFHVTVLAGKGCIEDEETVKVTSEDGTESIIKTEAIIIATGSKANRFPPTNFDLPGVYDSDTIQGIQRIPEVLVVQGAGIVSVEYALIFAKLGSKVTVIDGFPAFLPMLDESLQEAVKQTLAADGIELLMSTPFKSVEGGEGSSAESPKIKIDVGERQFECDCLLSATGRHANTATLGLDKLEAKGLKVNRGKMVEVDYTGHSGCGKIYAVGDCATGSMGLATMGQAQAVRAARSLYTESGLMKSEKKQEVKPFGIWTIPDLAWAGATEDAARKQGIDYSTCTARYNQTTRGCVTDEDGFLKLVYNRADGVVLGVHLFGENSCELINYGAEVVEKKSTIFEMLHFVFPAVTYHTLYVMAAAEGKLRLKGARCLAAATKWRRLQEMVQNQLNADGEASSVTVAKKLKKVFVVFDEDKSGFLSKDQLHNAVQKLGISSVTEEDIEGMIEEATGDISSEQVDYETFLTMLAGGKPSEEEIEAELKFEQKRSSIRNSVVPFGHSATMVMEEIGLTADPDVYDLIVIGGGPAGVRAAEEGASRGKKVGLIEPKAMVHGAPTGAHSKCIREAVLGGAKSWADVTQVLDKAMENSQGLTSRMFKTFNVEHLQGLAKLQDESTVLFTPNEGEPRALKTSYIAIATGSKANRFPPTNFELPGVFDSDTIAAIDRVPNHLVVQGSGIAGVEYGVMFAMLGAKVTIVDAFPAFLPFLDEDLRNAVKQTLVTNNIEVIMSTPFKTVEAGEGSTAAEPKLKIDMGERGTLECDALFSATGRSGYTNGLGLEELASKGLTLLPRGKLIQVDENGYTGCGGIYACGDCATGSMGLATMGQSQAVRAVRTMFTKTGLLASEKKTEVKPSGVWTIPEVAWAGITEEKAKEDGINFGVGKAEYRNTIRGCVSNEVGFLKIVFNRDGGTILGVHICGDLSCELVNYGAELVNARSTIFEVLHFVFPAVTHHELYNKAATHGKIRLRGVKDLSAAVAWKRMQNMAKKAYADLGGSETVEGALRKMFEKYDTDESGFLDRQQFRNVVAALGFPVSDEDIVTMIVEATGDKDADSVDYDSMLEMLAVK